MKVIFNKDTPGAVAVEPIWTDEGREKLGSIVCAFTDPQDVFRSCLNCDHWQSEFETCGLVLQKPPAPVIVYGCGEWQLIEIPF